MSDWFDAWQRPPPEDGAWIIAVNNDFSGLEFLAYFDGEWRDSEGQGDLFDAGNFRIHYSVWSPAPKWMRPFVSRKDSENARKQWREGVAA